MGNAHRNTPMGNAHQYQAMGTYRLIYFHQIYRKRPSKLRKALKGRNISAMGNAHRNPPMGNAHQNQQIQQISIGLFSSNIPKKAK
jgi:hypothetical protein